MRRCLRVIHMLALLRSIGGAFSLRSFFRRAPNVSATSPRHGVISRTSKVFAARPGGAIPSAAIAGRLRPILKKISRVPAEFSEIYVSVSGAFDFGDAVVLGLVALFTKPLAKRYFYLRHEKRDSFEDSRLCRFATTIQQLATITGVVYVFDLLFVVMTSLGFNFDIATEQKVAKAVYTVWGAWRLRGYKDLMLRRALKRAPEEQGRLSIIGKVLDGILAVVLFFFLEDIFQFSLGRGIASLLTAGGTTAIVFSLASKSLATTFVNGLAIQASRKFAEGDQITLGDGTSGTVVKLNAFETLIKGSDGVVVRIPNEQVVAQRVKNLSITDTCQVTQTLWFRYEDIDKIPTVIGAIKDEIRSCCPKLIIDGSRPFRVTWTDFKEDHLNVQVDVNFDIKPFGNEYWDNRQVVLEAIARAVNHTGVLFCLPNSICKNEYITPNR